MATIFQKTATDNCVVLQSREALLYPFDIGPWTELRVGVELSYVANTGGFDVVAPGEINVSNTALNSFFMGFKNTGSQFPDTSNDFIIGYTQRNPGALVSFNNYIEKSNFFELAMGMISGSDAFIIDRLSVNRRIVYCGVGAATGTTQYAGQNGFRIILTNAGQTGQFMTMDTCYNQSSSSDPFVGVTPSITGLRNFISAFPNATSGVYRYLTNGFTSSGAPLDFPNAFFLYCPFLSGSMRIHTLLIERYA